MVDENFKLIDDVEAIETDSMKLILNDIRVCMVTDTYIRLLNMAKNIKVMQPNDYRKNVLQLIDAFNHSVSIGIEED